jgi:hypothetical protein
MLLPVLPALPAPLEEEEVKGLIQISAQSVMIRTLHIFVNLSLALTAPSLLASIVANVFL